MTVSPGTWSNFSATFQAGQSSERTLSHGTLPHRGKGAHSPVTPRAGSPTLYPIVSAAGLETWPGGPLAWGTHWWSSVFTWPGGALIANLSSTCNPGCGVTFYLPNGTYTLIIPHAIPLRYATQYATPGIRGLGITVNGTGQFYLFPYSLQFLLQTQSVPPSLGGSVSPSTQWVINASNVTLSAANPPGWQFRAWTGSGTGSYSGPNASANVSMLSPINETAVYEPLYSVTFTESGLPSLTPWSVSVGNMTLQGTNSRLSLQLLNGTYPYAPSSPIPRGYGTRYSANVTTGSARVSGASVTLAVSFHVQFLVTFSVVPAGAGSVNQTGGWIDGNSTVLAQATEAPMWKFHGWTAVGRAGYSGPSDPALLRITSPLNETARFVHVYRLSILVVPATCGPVLLNGTSDGNGSVIVLEAGNYSLSARPCAGYSFDQWQTSGGSSVYGASAANTTATVASNGSLTATYAALPRQGSPSVALSPSLGVDIGLAAILLAEIVLLALMGRKRRDHRHRSTAGREPSPEGRGASAERAADPSPPSESPKKSQGEERHRPE